jgi:hypothetical protein
MDKIADTTTSALIKGGLRSIAASVPIVASFGQAWSEYESQTKSLRVDEFFRTFRELVARMQAELTEVKHHIETSGEFPALLEKTVEHVQRELSARKRRLYAQALLNNVVAGPARPYEEKLNIIDALDALTERDLQLLHNFASGADIQINDFVFSTQFFRDERDWEAQLGPVVASLSKLVARGLVSETAPANRAFDYSGSADHWINRWRRKTFVLIPFGKIVLESLKEMPPQPQPPVTGATTQLGTRDEQS